MKKFLIFIGLFFLAKTVFAQGFLDLGEISISASRRNFLASEMSQGVSVITAEDIQASVATSIPELIAERSGTIVSNELGNPKGFSIDIRGFGETSASNVLVLVDSRRTNQVDLSGVDWAQISLDSVDRIEIIRGPATVLYGDNAAAGIINIVTKKGSRLTEGPLTLRTEFGSFQHYKQAMSISRTFKNVDYFLNYSHEHKSGYRNNNDYWANNYFGNASWSISDQLILKFSSGYHRDRYGMPGALFSWEIESLGRRATTKPDDRAWTSDVFFNIEPEIKFDFKEHNMKFSLFHSYRKRYAKSLFVSSGGSYETAHRIDSFEVQPKIEVDSSIGENFQNQLTAGVDFFYARNRVRSGSQDEEQDRVDIKKQTVSFYVLDRLRVFENFFIHLGARSLWAEYAFDQTAVEKNKETKSPSEAALSFGVGYQYQENSQIYFDYVRSFRLPATDEYYQNVGWWGGGLNTQLNHQIGNNFQLGIRDHSRYYLKTDLSLFFMDTKNEIYYDPMTFENSNYLAQTRRWGVELDGKGSFLKGFLQPYVHWIWQDAFFKGGDYSGNKIPFVPRNKISAGITTPLSEALQTTFSFQWVDRRFVISDINNSQAQLNSILTFNFKINYQWKDFYSWVGIKNISNRMYNAYGVYSVFQDDIGYYPAPGRQIAGGFRVDF